MTTRRFFRTMRRRFNGTHRAVRMVRAGQMECRARAAIQAECEALLAQHGIQPEGEIGVMMNGCMFPVERRES